MAKVAVLLSGGVDSAFAALHLTSQGHDVEGFTAVLYEEDPASSEDLAAARGICGGLAIPHSVVDLRDEFKRCVVDPFISAYADGVTPNPCAWCNRDVKLGILARLVLERGFHSVATGHYARVARIEGRMTLCEPLDKDRSQVYFLSLVDPDALGSLMLPLGDFRKADVRMAVGDAGLPARGRDSQDLCFVAGGNYHDFLKIGGGQPGVGRVLDTDGNVVAGHRGHTAYTVGQRFGFRGRRFYVLEKRPLTNEVVIGRREEALKTRITATRVNYFQPRGFMERDGLCVRYRYNSDPVGAAVSEAGPNQISVITDQPCFAPAPGQVLAGYINGCLVFGGVIESAR
jgi:tRNA-specific 2-thiouridylase